MSDSDEERDNEITAIRVLFEKKFGWNDKHKLKSPIFLKECIDMELFHVICIEPDRVEECAKSMIEFSETIKNLGFDGFSFELYCLYATYADGEQL